MDPADVVDEISVSKQTVVFQPAKPECLDMVYLTMCFFVYNVMQMVTISM